MTNYGIAALNKKKKNTKVSSVGVGLEPRNISARTSALLIQCTSSRNTLSCSNLRYKYYLPEVNRLTRSDIESV